MRSLDAPEKEKGLQVMFLNSCIQARVQETTSLTVVGHKSHDPCFHVLWKQGS